MKKILPILSLCILFAACNNSSNNTNAQAAQEQNQPADWEITAKVKEIILTDGALLASNRLVSVSTTNGVVTLTGNVSSQDQIDEIVSKARSVPGVKNVNNQMTLSP